MKLMRMATCQVADVVALGHTTQKRDGDRRVTQARAIAILRLAKLV
jgi:hypothetical protein